MAKHPNWFQLYWYALNNWSDRGRSMFDKLDRGYLLNGHITRNAQILRNNALHHRSKKAWASVPQLRKRDLWDHVQGRETLFYTNNRDNGRMLAMIDVDGHRPGQRPDEVKDAILARFPDIYFERSTHGQGWHLYVVISGPSAAARNELAQLLVDSLAALVPNPDMTLDGACGTYATMTQGKDLGRRYWEYVSDGQLAKFPRLLDGSINTELLEELRRKIAAGQWDDRRSRLPAHLVAACLDDQMGQRVLSLAYTRSFSAAAIHSLAALAGIDTQSQCQPRPQPTVAAASSSQFSQKTPCTSIGTCGTQTSSDSEDQLIDEPNGLARKRGVWLALKRELGRVPELQEYKQDYIPRYVRNPNKDHRERARQLEEVHEWCLQHCDDTADAPGFRLADYDWVLLSEAVLAAAICRRHRVTRELVCVIVYLAEHPHLQENETAWWFTCGIDRITAFCDRLYSAGTLAHRYSYHGLVSHAIGVAVDHGLVEQIDQHAYKQARKLIPGISNPALPRFLATYGRQVELVRNVNANTPGASRPDRHAARRTVEREEALAEVRASKVTRRQLQLA